MAMQFLPQYMWGGLSGMAPGLAALGQGAGQWFTPEAREDRAYMGSPYDWIDPYTLDFTPGAKKGMVKEYGPQLQVNPNLRGAWAFSPELQPGWKWKLPGEPVPTEWGAAPKGGWGMPEAEEGMAVTGDWLPRFLSAPSGMAQSLFDQMRQGASKQIGGPVKRQGGTNLLLDLIGFEKEEIPILAHEGEVVLRKEAVDILGGPHEVDALNKMFDAGQQGDGTTQKKGMPTAQKGLALTRGYEEPEETPEEQLKKAMLSQMLGGQPTPPSLGGGDAFMGVNVPQAPPGYEEFARVFRQKYASMGPITEEHVQEAWRQSLMAHPENPMVTLMERPGEVPGGLKTTDEYIELPPLQAGPPDLSYRAGQESLPEWFFRNMPPIAGEGEPGKAPVKPKAGAKGKEPTAPIAPSTPPPQPAAPGWRAPGSAMPIDWQAISQMDPASVAQYLQVMAQTQGQLPGALMNRMRRGTAGPAATMPGSQQLFGQLMSQYEGLQGTEVEASAVRKARQEDDAYWDGMIKDAKEQRDADLLNTIARTRNLDAQREVMMTSAAASQADPAKMTDMLLKQTQELIDGAWDMVTKRETPETLRAYHRYVLEYEFIRNDSLMYPIGDETEDDFYKRIIDSIKTKKRGKKVPTREDVDASILKVQTLRGAGGSGMGNVNEQNFWQYMAAQRGNQ